MYKKTWLNFLIQEAFFFTSTYLVGIALVFRIKQTPQIQKNFNTQPILSNPWFFLLNFAIITLIFFLLLPLFKKRPLFLKGFFIIGIFIGLDITIDIFIGEPYGFILAFILSVLIYQYPKIVVHNLLFSLSLAGVGSVLALSFSPKAIIIILASLAFYDIIAVYFTKHMVKMARVPARQGIFFGIILPQKIQNYFRDNPQFEFTQKRSFAFLGGGDIVLPLMLPISIAQKDLLRSIVIFLFLLLGLVFLSFIFNTQKRKKPMPGLPPLSLAVILGYIIASLI